MKHFAFERDFLVQDVPRNVFCTWDFLHRAISLTSKMFYFIVTPYIFLPSGLLHMTIFNHNLTPNDLFSQMGDVNRSTSNNDRFDIFFGLAF